MSLNLAPKIPLSELNPDTTPVLDIPDAGRYFGQSRGQAYQAARDGKIPTVQISAKRKVVPTAALLRMLAIDPTDTPASDTSAA